MRLSKKQDGEILMLKVQRCEIVLMLRFTRLALPHFDSARLDTQVLRPRSSSKLDLNTIYHMLYNMRTLYVQHIRE